jgi:hypothetical protein
VIIDEALVAGVARMAAASGVDDALREELRQAYPGIRFTLCTEDDIHGGKPVHHADGFEIYLVGSSDHCLSLTNDYALASGVVIAETYPEDA